MSGYRSRQYRIPEAQIRLCLREKNGIYSCEPLDSPEAAVRALAGEISEYDRECVCVVNIDVKNRPINYNMAALGSLDQCPVSITNILKSAILSNASGMILMHPHPSGDVTPSEPDLQVTKQLSEACCLMNIRLLDHIIVGCGTGKRCSIRETHPQLFC